MKLIIIYLLTCLLAIGAFSNDALIKEHLQKLGQSDSYKANGIFADFLLETNFLEIDLLKSDECKRERSYYCPVIDVGKINFIVDATKEAGETLSTLAEIQDSSWIMNFAEKRDNLNKFKSKIKDGNTSKLSWISLKQEFAGKNLSYPLICGALEILQNVYKKELVFLDDALDRPRYYTELGFVDVGESYRLGKVMFGSIADILRSHKCKLGYGASASEHK